MMYPSMITPSSVKRGASSVPPDDFNKNTSTAMTATDGSSPDLNECSASAIAEFLTQQRFSGDVDKSLQFLHQVINALPWTPDADAPHNTNKTSSMDLGDPLLQTPLETSLLNPRGGKCSIQLYQNGFLVATQLKDPSEQLILPASAVSHCIIFAKAEDYKLLQSDSSKPKKVPNAHLVLLKFHDTANAIQFQNKNVQEHICFALPWVKGIGPTGPETTCNDPPHVQSGWREATQAWRNVLETCLSGPKNNNPDLKMVQVQPQRIASAPFFSYQSPDQSTTTGGMPFVKCYQGVHDGVLYPLREGLLFYKPPMFLPRSELVSITCGRGSGGGPSSSRYVDMVVQQKRKGDTVEFTNIQREELGVLNEYIHQILIPAMQADGRNNNNIDASKNEDGDDSSEDEDDAETEDDTDDEDENFVDGNEEEEGDDDDDDSVDSADDDADDDDDGFELVEDDFVKELSKSSKTGKLTHDEPRASRSRSNKRKKGTPIVHQVVGDIVAENDGDFEVAQIASSTESEGEDNGSTSGSSLKKSRY